MWLFDVYDFAGGGVQLLEDLALTIAEVPELRLHPLETLGCRLFRRAARFELDGKVVRRDAIAVRLLASAIQLCPQFLALRFQHGLLFVELTEERHGL